MRLLYIWIGNHIWRIQWHNHIRPWVTLKGQSQSHSDFEALYHVKEQSWAISYWLNINGKAYMGSPMTLSHLTLCDPERPASRSLRYQRIISRKTAELAYKLLLNTNRKSYMRSSKPPLHLTLNDLDRSKLRCWIWSKIHTCIVRYCVRVQS